MNSYSKIIGDSFFVGHGPIKWSTKMHFLELDSTLSKTNIWWFLKWQIIGAIGGIYPFVFIALRKLLKYDDGIPFTVLALYGLGLGIACILNIPNLQILLSLEDFV